MVAPLVVLAFLSLWIPFGANPLNPASGWFLSSWATTPTSVVPATAQPVMHAAEGGGHEGPAAPEAGAHEGGADAGGKLAAYQETLEHEVHHLHETGIPHLFSLPALLSLLIAGSGIAYAFMRYGRAGSPGQKVSWDQSRGVTAFLANRWYQDNLYEKFFPVGVTMLLSRVLAWFDQNIVDGIVNGVGALTVGLSRVTSAFDVYVVDGIVNSLAGIAQFFGLLFRQLQTGRVQTYVVYVVIGVVVLFFAFR
jgi:NADH-quinone oxidoreductase subunit L